VQLVRLRKRFANRNLQCESFNFSLAVFKLHDYAVAIPQLLPCTFTQRKTCRLVWPKSLFFQKI